MVMLGMVSIYLNVMGELIYNMALMTGLKGSSGAGPVLTTQDAETKVTSKTAKRKEGKTVKNNL